MDLSYVRKLIKLVSESDVHEIEIEEEGKKVRVTKASQVQSPVQMQVPAAQVPVVVPASSPVTAPAGSAPHAPAGSKLHEIKSPIVGTFYKAPAPDAAPFVSIGTHVEPGTVLCIVEAMKLMNEIESDAAGTVVKIMVENGQPVEYGQVLFLVEPS
jgi:acetyl-CoA carboxylase biotin carboxyl carrier protein